MINGIEKYMLTTKNMATFIRLENKNNNYNSELLIDKTRVNIIKKEQINPITQIKPITQINPKSKISNIVQEQSKTTLQDTLFWNFYIILYGEHEYEMNKSFKKEKEFKIESVEKLRAFKSELKGMKLRLNEIEDELANQNKITKKGLVALCLLHKINIMYVWNRKYFEIINDADKEVHVIINDGNGNNSKIMQLSLDQITDYRDNYWCIENIEKPLKAMTSYSKDELMAIITKLDVKDIVLKNTKKDMYQRILEHL